MHVNLCQAADFGFAEEEVREFLLATRSPGSGFDGVQDVLTEAFWSYPERGHPRSRSLKLPGP